MSVLYILLAISRQEKEEVCLLSKERARFLRGLIRSFMMTENKELSITFAVET